MINIENLYLAIIIRRKDYYKNINNQNRYYNGINYDPFFKEDDVISEYIGIPTIVLKNNDKYEDLLFSRFKNEILYKLNEFNKMGIKLIYLKPFSDYYPDYTQLPMIYEIPNNLNSSFLQDFMPYLFFPYETTNGVYMILNDDEPLDEFYFDYRVNFMNEKNYKPVKGPKYKKLVLH